VDVSTGMLQFRFGGTTITGSVTSSGTGVVEFGAGTHTLETSSTVTAQDIRFSGTGTATISGTYSAGKTTISTGTVDMSSSSGGAPGSFNLTGGTLIPPPRLEIHGDFVRTGGTYTHSGNTLAFVGGTAQDLTVSADTTFNNIEVGPGTRLIETEVPDRIIVDGTLVNYGTIRKAKPTVAGPMTFGLTAVDMDITTLGGLTNLRVDRVDCQHPDAFGEALTDRHWKMKPTGSGYELDITLGHAVSPESNVWLCRHLALASPWDCARTTWDADSITLEGITALTDLAPGDSRLAGYLMVSGFEYCAKWSFVLDEEEARAKSSAFGAGCGGWFELDTMEARTDQLTRGSAAKSATGRITGSVFDRASGHPAVGVEVLFASNGVLAGRTKTNREGRYVSPKLAEGTYSVMTHGGRDYLHEQWSGVQCWAAPDPTLGYPVVVSRGRIAAGVDFDLERGARVSGEVIDSDNGQAVVGATVRILSEGGDVIAEVLSDGEGRYRTLPLPVGVYTAVGSARSDGLTVTSSPVAVAVGCGPARADLVVR
jgi:hypothetical protein